MDEIEGGTLVVNKGDEEKNKTAPGPDERNLNAVEGLAEGWKLAAVRVSSSSRPPLPPSHTSQLLHRLTYKRSSPSPSSR